MHYMTMRQAKNVRNLVIGQRKTFSSVKVKATRVGESIAKTKTKVEPKKTNKYGHTILLPQTRFPTWQKGRERIETDQYIIKKCGFSDLYEWQRNNLPGPDFVLHDGPPYANGAPHVGHAINKILKDITLRNKVIRGKRVHYVPGWDCHGLPIELKVLSNGEDLINDPIKIRRQARNYAMKAVDEQRRAFRSWGVMADWSESGCYFTDRSSYVKNQLQQFIKLYEKGLIFRDFMPVYWSPSSRTALAESELEYNEDHQSKSAIVRLRLNNLPHKLKSYEGRLIYALTWTTTPWTLVANQALAFSPDIEYCVAEDTDRNLNIVARQLLDSISSKVGLLKFITSIDGKELAGSTYHGLFDGRELPFLAAHHVTGCVGTGFVHTAPAHGPEDFLVALQNNMRVVSVVDIEGRYNEAAGSEFQGLEVLKEGTEKVLNSIGQDVLHVEMFTHRYPYDWRTKKPVVIRASNQWFFDVNAVKQRAIDSIADVMIYPECNRAAFENALLGQIKSRPYWCISRQRSWGTPIPILCSKRTGKATTSRTLVERLCQSIDQYGPDCWWEFPAEKLIGLDVFEELNLEQNDVEKGKDILDIWFDSGTSWSTVLPEGKADIYLEGIDQFTGWFQSSLLTSIALQESPPYRALFAHGFAVDEKASKMSKSLGNVIDPEIILTGGPDLAKQPAYGVNTLRWWVASHGCQHSQVVISNELLEGCAQSIQKLRSTMRFLLGILHPYENKSLKNIEPRYRMIDEYMLHSLYLYNKQMQKHYDDYEYHHACKTIMRFVVNDVSALYCQLIKDRVYCDGTTSSYRVAALLVAGEIVSVLARTVAPIIPHLAEEVWLYHPENLESVPLYRTTYDVPEAWNKPRIAQKLNVAFRIKHEINKLSQRNSWELSASIVATTADFASLSMLHDKEQSSTSELCEILQVSSVTLLQNECIDRSEVKVKNIEKPLCERCRRYPGTFDSGLCARCSKLLLEMKIATA